MLFDLFAKTLFFGKIPGSEGECKEVKGNEGGIKGNAMQARGNGNYTKAR